MEFGGIKLLDLSGDELKDSKDLVFIKE